MLASVDHVIIVHTLKCAIYPWYLVKGTIINEVSLMCYAHYYDQG